VWALALGAVWVLVVLVLQRSMLFPSHATRPHLEAGRGIAGLERLHVMTDEGEVEAWLLPGEGASADSPGRAVVFAHGNAELIDLALKVEQRESGECGLSWTNGLAGGRGFFGDGPEPLGACGPFGFRRFRLDLVGSNCAPGDSCVGFMELSEDGTLRVDEFGGTEEVVESTLPDNEIARARSVLATDLVGFLAMEMPCPSVTDSSAVMTLELATAALGAETAGCTEPIVSAARDLMYELAERPPP
jgi:hypothetical protein